MANDWFSGFTRLIKGAKAKASTVNALFDQVETGMDKMPTEAQLNRGTRNYEVDTGEADAYVVTLSHISTAYQDGQEVVFLTANANTGASTLNVSGIGPVAITLNEGSALPAGAIAANSLVKVQYNTTLNKWQLHGVFEITNSVTAFVATLLDDETAVAFLATLGITSTSTELNLLDGVTSTTAELNILDGVTSAAAELNILDGVTATAAELNYNDITTLGIAQASKVVTVAADGSVNFPSGTQVQVDGESTSLSSAASAITVGSLSFPAGRTIEFEAYLIGVTGAVAALYLDLNADATATNYYSNIIADGVSAGAINAPDISLPLDASDYAIISGTIIPNTTTNEVLITWTGSFWDNSAGVVKVYNGSVRYTASDVITEIKLKNLAANNYIDAGSTLRVKLK